MYSPGLTLVLQVHEDVFHYVKEQKLPYNPLHDEGYTSIGDVVSTEKADVTKDGERGGRFKNQVCIPIWLRTWIPIWLSTRCAISDTDMSIVRCNSRVHACWYRLTRRWNGLSRCRTLALVEQNSGVYAFFCLIMRREPGEQRVRNASKHRL